MPLAAGRHIHEEHIPSFMTVYEIEDEVMQDRDTVTVMEPLRMMDIDETEAVNKVSNAQEGFPQAGIVAQDPSSHRHQDSTSTRPSESAGSSPTTSASCTDSSSPSDPSPSSSPDSPLQLLPLNSFAATTFGSLSSITPINTVEVNTLARPVTSPSPRRRNMKNLSIQPPSLSPMAPAIPSDLVSPAFIKPKPPAMKKKPSLLTLNTNTTDLSTKPTMLEIPPSPALPMLQRRALKHSVSTPHMLTGLKSSGVAPLGGMTLPPIIQRNESGLSTLLRASQPSNLNATTIMEEDSPIKAQVANRSVFADSPFHENEGNEDQKSPGYPNGPVAIYDDNVYLYLEPTADEASRFDVVINVAREVLNPFARHKEQQQNAKDEAFAKQQQKNKADKRASMMTIPDTAISMASYATAFEFIPDETTPTTPKPTFAEPEYIHMPWDHNTDIGPDLMSLCETIDRQTKDGKRVLVHCQQGASRSASLIIAYGLYQNPEMSVNDAYYKAQGKSKWISPNMRLMYCLQDFQKQVSKRKLSPGSAQQRSRSGKSPSKHRLALSVDAIDIPSNEPRTAPLPNDEGSTPRTYNNAGKSPLRGRGNSTPGSFTLSPGPSSAPSSFSWSEREAKGGSSRFFASFDHEALSPLPSSQQQILVASLSRSLDDRPKPPPSPGFAAHRFGKDCASPGLGGFVPLQPSGRFPTFSDPSTMMPGAFPSFLDMPPTRAPPPPPPSSAPSSSSSSAPAPAAEPPVVAAAAAAAAPTATAPSLPTLTFSALPTIKMSKPKTLSLKQPSDFQSTNNDAPLDREIIITTPRFTSAIDETDLPLMSPRAETITHNPLHDSFAEMQGMHFVESPPTPTPEEALFSPSIGAFPSNPFGTFAASMGGSGHGHGGHGGHGGFGGFGETFTKPPPSPVVDPRSPPMKGEAPIVRSIDEIL